MKTLPLVLILILLVASCSQQQTLQTTLIPSGNYQLGSDSEERRWGYKHSPSIVLTQQWYDHWEMPPYKRRLPTFSIDKSPVSQIQYADFVKATGHRVPWISASDYQQQGYLVHPYTEVKPYLWRQNQPAAALQQHPVVLVSQDDARAYCHWRGMRLPSESEWEAACRGPEGRRFPWGNQWTAANLQHQSNGTAAIGSHPMGATSNGIVEMLGNTFEWTDSDYTATQNDYAPTQNDYKVLKSCSWDDAPGTCRCGFRHGRSPQAKHILIGFRCAANR